MTLNESGVHRGMKGAAHEVSGLGALARIMQTAQRTINPLTSCAALSVVSAETLAAGL